ncbi:MAG: response regulator transcription factor [Bacteroidaceae bacterium]|nr:response regulator transcription factor [Bacteroidaceae bacterium]
MDEKKRLLLCEDDENLGMLLREYLQAKGYESTLCADGQEGLETFQQGEFDLCVLDVMMPVKDGFTLAREIREINPQIPIIFLTAKTLGEDKVQGFKIGADDYITKPFSMEELTFRIEAVLRRSCGGKVREKNVYQFGIYQFDKVKQSLTYQLPDQGTLVSKLTTKENALLALLCQNVNEMMQRDYALRTIWEEDNYFNARSMDVYITKLRKLLKDDPRVEIINIHGRGYKLVVPEEEI